MSELSSSSRTDMNNTEPILRFGLRPLSENNEESTLTPIVQDTWGHPRDLSSNNGDAFEHRNTQSHSGDPTHQAPVPADTCLDDSDSFLDL